MSGDTLGTPEMTVTITFSPLLVPVCLILSAVFLVALIWVSVASRE